jgi:predicted metal-dependent phosphoesterase TrpH
METNHSKTDLHLHTTASDSAATARELLVHVARTDLRVIAITDHDTITAA